jgi:signal transduction histidine kinase
MLKSQSGRTHMDANVAKSSNENAPTHSWQSLWKWIVKVPPTDSEQERRTRLVAVIAAVLSAVTMLAAVWAQLRFASNAHFVILLNVFGISVAAYILNRQGYYRVAALALIGMFIFAPMAALLASEKNLALLGFTALIASVGVLLIGVFFPGRNSGLATIVIIMLSYLVVPILQPTYSFADIIYPIIGVIAISLTSIMIENHHAALENDRQAKWEAENEALRSSAEALQRTNTKLEQQLKDTNVELDATVDEFMRVTEEVEQAKADAERANTVKSAFLASMSHELRTPLNAVLNFSQFVSSGMLGPVNDEQIAMLEKITFSGKHLLSLINDVLDISKIEAGSLRLFVEEDVDLVPEAEAAADTGRALLEEKPVKLQLEVAPDLPHILADKRRVRQILLNLVANACKFTESGSVTISLRSEDQEVHFSVKDTGPGIAPEDRETIFEAFRQTKIGMTQGSGTGLGLTISKRLAEAHGGRLWLESEVGVGSTFHVVLPVHSPVLAQMMQEAESGS